MNTQSFKKFATQALYFYAGIGQGIVDTVKGVAKLAVLPYVKGYEGLKQGADFIYHPQQKAEAEFQRAKEDYQSLKKLWNNPQEEIAKKKSQLSNIVQREWFEFKKPYQSSDPNVRAKAWGETAFTALSVLDGAAELKGLMVVEKEAALMSKAVSIEEAGVKALSRAENEAAALSKLENIETKIISKGETIGAKTAEPSLAASSTLQASIQLQERIPAGFSSTQQFEEFSNIFKEGLLKTGDPEAVGVLRGSSVTGVKHSSGLPFDVGKKSDFDLAVVSPKLLGRAEELGVDLRGAGTRTGPLNYKNPFERALMKELDLKSLENKLSDFTQRKISFVFYKSEEAVALRGEYLLFK